MKMLSYVYFLSAIRQDVLYQLVSKTLRVVKFHIHAQGNTLVCLMFDVSFIFGVSSSVRMMIFQPPVKIDL